MTFIHVVQRLAVVAFLATTAGCSLLRPSADFLLLEYPDSESAPEYRPGLRYLPLAQGATMSWVVLSEQKPVIGTPQPLSIWYGQSGRLLRTHGGKLVEIAGYTPKPLRIADNCPYLSHLKRFRQNDCIRTYMTPETGVYLSRVRVRQLAPAPFTYRLGGRDFNGSIVREVISAAARQGNFYVYDADGKYVMSRQWLDDSQFFDVFAAEQAQ